jgi:rhamnosyl/mannosyltransferase
MSTTPAAQIIQFPAASQRSAPLRVLHVYKTCWSESYGGIEQAIRQLCLGTRQLAATHNFIFTLSRHKERHVGRVHGAGVIRFPLSFELASTGISWSALAAFRQIARRMDVIHYHFPWPFADLLHLSQATPKPSVLTYHSDIVRQQRLLPLYRPLLNRFLGSVDRIVATSPNYFATSHTLDHFQDKVSIIPLGLDEKTYPAVSEERLQHWRNILGTDFLLFVGALRYYKGLHRLLDAASGTDMRVVIVGAGPMEAELQPRVLSPELANVHMLGHLPEEDKVALLKLCRALVFPSHLRSEAFGFSLLEAAMYGKPMISSEIGTGTSFINAHKETGLVISPFDTDALQKAMLTLYNDRQLAEHMGQQARQRYLELFTAEKMSAAYLEIYQQLLAKRTPAT